MHLTVGQDGGEVRVEPDALHGPEVLSFVLQIPMRLLGCVKPHPVVHAHRHVPRSDRHHGWLHLHGNRDGPTQVHVRLRRVRLRTRRGRHRIQHRHLAQRRQQCHARAAGVMQHRHARKKVVHVARPRGHGQDLAIVRPAQLGDRATVGRQVRGLFAELLPLVLARLLHHANLHTSPPAIAARYRRAPQHRAVRQGVDPVRHQRQTANLLDHLLGVRRYEHQVASPERDHDEAVTVPGM
mmetsp:Transcript_26058/g.83824  ORF Transcript_26058/g.83824 Transcript_26058/m.83824 type:complete len:239 (-) Transcript_26058:310-1026(-)